jgi:hypothetical protein
MEFTVHVRVCGCRKLDAVVTRVNQNWMNWLNARRPSATAAAAAATTPVNSAVTINIHLPSSSSPSSSSPPAYNPAYVVAAAATNK